MDRPLAPGLHGIALPLTGDVEFLRGLPGRPRLDSLETPGMARADRGNLLEEWCPPARQQALKLFVFQDKGVPTLQDESLRGMVFLQTLRTRPE